MDIFVVGLALRPAIPRVIVAFAVGIPFTVGVVVLFVITDEIAQG